MKLWFDLCCKDIEAKKEFCRRVLGLVEVERRRSAIYRALEGPHLQLGFNAHAAYALLNLEPPSGTDGTSWGLSFPTFVLEAPLAVDAVCTMAAVLGAAVIKATFISHCGQRQAVVSVPEGNLLRVAGST